MRRIALFWAKNTKKWGKGEWIKEKKIDGKEKIALIGIKAAGFSKEQKKVRWQQVLSPPPRMEETKLRFKIGSENIKKFW